MRAAWDSYQLVAPSRELHCDSIGEDHEIDEWADPGLAHYLAWACRVRAYDMVIVNYTWLSFCLEAIPSTVFKVCDTHDVFADRRRLLQANGIAPEFFHTTREEEAKGLSRADLVWAIKKAEQDYFERDLGLPNCLTMLHAEPERGWWHAPPFDGRLAARRRHRRAQQCQSPQPRGVSQPGAAGDRALHGAGEDRRRRRLLGGFQGLEPPQSRGDRPRRRCRRFLSRRRRGDRADEVQHRPEDQGVGGAGFGRAADRACPRHGGLPDPRAAAPAPRLRGDGAGTGEARLRSRAAAKARGALARGLRDDSGFGAGRLSKRRARNWSPRPARPFASSRRWRRSIPTSPAARPFAVGAGLFALHRAGRALCHRRAGQGHEIRLPRAVRTAAADLRRPGPDGGARRRGAGFLDADRAARAAGDPRLSPRLFPRRLPRSASRARALVQRVRRHDGRAAPGGGALRRHRTCGRRRRGADRDAARRTST